MFNNILNIIKSLKFLKSHNSSLNLFSKTNWILSMSKINTSIRVYINYINSLTSKFKLTNSLYNHILFISLIYLYVIISVLLEIYLYIAL